MERNIYWNLYLYCLDLRFFQGGLDYLWWVQDVSFLKFLVSFQLLVQWADHGIQLFLLNIHFFNRVSPAKWMNIKLPLLESILVNHDNFYFPMII